MARPLVPRLTGIHRDKVWNRFEWDYDKIPSPKRSATYPRTTEHVPVQCRWCGLPYWPDMHVIEGCCSELCLRADAAFQEDTRRRRALVAAYQADLEAIEAPGCLEAPGIAGRRIVT